MPDQLPEYYFRVRDNGALVFRVDIENRQRRIEMDQIATANVRNGEIKPHGSRALSEEDMAAIRLWIEQRQVQLAQREVDDFLRVIDTLNMAAQWVQSRATAEQLESVTDQLLLAMHDLRTVLVRKRSERIAEAEDTAPLSK